MATIDPPLIAIVGETASGKSGVALRIAERFNGELVCADSRTVYQEMDIGTAKPSAAEQTSVRHHLLSIVSPDDNFTAAQFKQLAEAAVADIRARGRLPILVGGTGLYIDSVLFNYSFSSGHTKGTREELETLSLPELQARASQELQIESTQLLKNRRHLIRQLETGGTNNQDKQLIDNVFVCGLQIPRSKLRQQIEKRVETMFKRGLRREVEELVQRYGWESEALTGIGYREFKGYYDGEISMTKVKGMIVKNTLGLAKRQRTWFKRNQQIEWYDSAAAAEAGIAEFLNGSGYTDSNE